jgi:peroxiredoxin
MSTTRSTRTRPSRQRRPDQKSTSGRGHSTRRRIPRLVIVVGVGVLAVLGLFAIYLAGRGGDDGGGSGDGAPVGAGSGLEFAVGDPGPGEDAPPLRLPSTAGGTFDLTEQRGQRVLLYFQEGVMCQPCWDQMVDIEARWGEFGDDFAIDQMVAITSDPLDVLVDKVSLDGIQSPALSDPGVAVSKTYEANLYGMMGTSMNGHSFVLVGPDGTIEWRADYGGKPDHTMFVPVDGLLADLRQGLSSRTTNAQQ